MIPIKRLINIFHRLNNLSLFKKFTLIYIICVMIPIIAVNTIMMSRVSYYVMMREEEAAVHSMSAMAGNIKDAFISIIIDANNIAADPDVIYTATNGFENSIDYYDYFNSSLKNIFSEYILHDSNISEITIYVNNPTITQGGNFFYLSDEIKHTRWYETASELDYSISLQCDVDRTESVVHRENRYISVIRRMNFDNAEHEAYIKMDVSLRSIDDFLEMSNRFNQVYVYDANGRTVFELSGEGTAFDVTSVTDLFYEQENYKKYEVPLGDENYIQGWSLIGFYNVERLEAMKNSEYLTSVIINSIIAVIALIMVYLVFYSFKYRMKKVEDSIYDMAHEKFAPVDVADSKDEVGRLIVAYNEMSVKINTLINDVYKLEMENKEIELEKTRAELNYLQSQIDPHFLFNVLNALLVASVKNHYDKIVPQISNVSKLFRRLLYWSDDYEPISEELEFIERYLQIEKFRFEDIFDYEINVSEGLLEYKIPKMSIQPIVENACRHGLQGKEGKRLLRIDITEAEGRCRIAVEDNGVGMSETRLEEIMANIKSSEASFKESIGLKNVYMRLRLCFGEDVDFNIYSKEGSGTRIVFSFRTEK